jgi:spore germination cell wall hydrolase CwlJ-like protein
MIKVALLGLNVLIFSSFAYIAGANRDMLFQQPSEINYQINDSAFYEAIPLSFSANINDVKRYFLNQISDEDRLCMQQNMYFEARGMSDYSMEAVGWVTVNRVEDSRYPDSICEVVQQGYRPGRRDCQFSWYCDGASDEPGTNVIEQRAWERAGEIADAMLISWLTYAEDPTDGATHYHADWVNPSWNRQLTRLAQVEEHIFYRWD